MFCSVPGATVMGIDGAQVEVEVQVAPGLPGFSIVGLPDEACREARDRVRAALINSGFDWPARRITVNLAPSGVRKGGAVLDLPIAVGVLVASGILDARLIAGFGFIGELGLDGSVREVSGAVSMVASLTACESLVVPKGCSAECKLVLGDKIKPVETLEEMVAALRGERPYSEAPELAGGPETCGLDLAEVKGHRLARLALELAAAGGHHLLMVGPPGVGKSMLASRIAGILPDLTPEEGLEVLRIHSAAGAGGRFPSRPPYRAPHHSASTVSIVGGGTRAMRPGEISLAHNGVLFLDELGEFAPTTLDALRQPLEEGVVRIARAHTSVEFPARCLLVAAMNPCPCGLGGPPGSCRCSIANRQRYWRRVSGPLLDRFDIRIELAGCDLSALEMLAHSSGEDSQTVAARVQEARQRCNQRGYAINAQLDDSVLDEFCPIDEEVGALLDMQIRKAQLSMRGVTRVRKLARTIADVAGKHLPDRSAFLLALQLRAQPDWMSL